MGPGIKAGPIFLAYPLFGPGRFSLTLDQGFYYIQSTSKPVLFKYCPTLIRRVTRMKSSKGFLLLIVASFLVLSVSCRRNQPSLIDRNKPPDTELWYVPADSTEYQYLVHVYWRGLDSDGTVVRYIWAITDTIDAQEQRRWNPAINLDDYMRGHLTMRTDSVFSFTAYKSIGGSGVKKNRQAFQIASIDDNGVIDPEPARIEFVAVIDKLPQVIFSTYIDSFFHDQKVTDTAHQPRLFNMEHLDTVGMYRSFRVSYHGRTVNGLIRALKWYPLSNIELRGADLWTGDLSDSVQYFINRPDSMAWFYDELTQAGRNAVPFSRHYEVLPSGVFRLAVRCLDDAKAESEVDPGRFTRGVVQVIINHDPETVLDTVINTYKSKGQIHTAAVNFRDDIPDTVPFRSWIRLNYHGWDNPGDQIFCEDDQNKCIKYQIQYLVTSERFSSLNFDTGLLPSEGPQDTNPCGVNDSTSMNVGTASYLIMVRSADENGKVDGMPEIAYEGGKKKSSTIKLIGNFDPTLDSLYLVDHNGNRVQDGDTLKWKWSEGTRVLVQDGQGYHWETTLSFRIRSKILDVLLYER
jgi:hypothetical protein